MPFQRWLTYAGLRNGSKGRIQVLVGKRCARLLQGT